MDENRNIMVPVSMLRDALNSSAHVYNKNELLVEKHSLTADFKLADDNGFVQYKGQFYASLDKLSKLLDMTCSFDTATNTLTMTDKSEGVSTVPTKYDLRERQRVSLIRDRAAMAPVGLLRPQVHSSQPLCRRSSFCFPWII